MHHDNIMLRQSISFCCYLEVAVVAIFWIGNRSSRPRVILPEVTQNLSHVARNFSNGRKEADSLLTIFDQTDVDSKLNILNDTLQSVLSLHAPVKQIKLRSRPCPFVNQEIKDLMRSRDLLPKQFIQSRQDTE